MYVSTCVGDFGQDSSHLKAGTSHDDTPKDEAKRYRPRGVPVPTAKVR